MQNRRIAHRGPCELTHAARFPRVMPCRCAAAHLGRRSWVGRHRLTDRPSASATACAAEHCTAIEGRCVVTTIHVRANHVVSSYSDALSLLARHSAPLRSSSNSVGQSPPNLDPTDHCSHDHLFLSRPAGPLFLDRLLSLLHHLALLRLALRRRRTSRY